MASRSSSPGTEETDDENVYVVKRILAEAGSDEDKVFLIEWEGYDLEESTWEPEGNVFSKETLKSWEDEKLRQREGLSEPFDLDEFDRLKEVYEKRKQQLAKKKKQKERRKFLDLTPSQQAKPQESESEEYVSSEEHASSDEAEEDQDTVPDYEGIPQPKNLRKSQVTQREPDPQDVEMNDPSDESDSHQLQGSRAPKPDKQPLRRAGRFINDTRSSKSTIEKTEPKDKTHKPLIIEAPSATGYQGTANRASRPHLIGRARSRSFRGKSRMTGRSSLMAIPKRRGNISIQERILKEAPLQEAKAPQLFSTKSLERKYELAARSLADRPPAHVPRLINPADYANQQRIRKRTSSSTLKSTGGSGTQSGSASINPQAILSSTTENTNPTQALFGPDDDSIGHLFEEPGEILGSEGKSPAQQAEERSEHPRPRKVTFAVEDAHRDDSNLIAQQLEQSSSGMLHSGASATAPPDAPFRHKSPPLERRRSSTSSLTSNHLASLEIPVPPVDAPSTQVRKVSLADYHAKQSGLAPLRNDVQTQNTSTGVTLPSIFGDREAQDALMMLTFIDVDVQDSSWESTIRQLNGLTFTHICRSTDIDSHKTEFNPTLIARGRVIAAASDDKKNQERIQVIADYLRASISGLIHNSGPLNIIIYPTRCQDWKFIELGVQIQQSDSLSFFAFTTSSDIIFRSYNISAENAMSQIKIGELEDYHLLNEEIFGYRYQSLVPVENKGPDTFFLLFPNMAAPLAQHTLAWLRHCNKNCKIFTCQQAGSWHQFLKTTYPPGAGTLIIHNTLIPLIPRFPKLQVFLQHGMNGVWCFDENFREGKFASRLYPHGGVVCLTSEFLSTEPGNAVHFLDWFLKNKAPRASTGTWKIFVCHDVYQYVSDQAIDAVNRREKLLKSLPIDLSEHNKEIIAANDGLSKTDCSNRFRIMDLLDRLLHFKNKDEMDFDAVLRPDKSRSIVVLANETILPNDNHGLVTYFAFWSVTELKSFRKFIAIGSKAALNHDVNLNTQIQGWDTDILKTLQTKAASTLKTSNSLKQKPVMEGISMVDGANDEYDDHSAQKDERGLENSHEIESPSPGESIEQQLKLKRVLEAPEFTDTNNNAEADKDEDAEFGVDTDPQILRFIRDTGATKREAIEFIRRAGGDNISRAVRLYECSLGAQIEPVATSSEIHNAVEELITQLSSNANELNETRSSTLDVAMEDAPDAVLSHLSTTTDANSQFKPTTIDGNIVQHPVNEPQARSLTSNAGIVTSESGERFVPRSVRESGTVRNALNIRPGYVPREDIEGYKVRRDGTPRLGSEPMSRSTSGSRSGDGEKQKMSGSNTPVSSTRALSSLAPVRRETHGIVGAEKTRKGVGSEKPFNTLEWYAEKKRRGEEWHHIAVVGWEEAHKLLRIEHKK